MRRLDGGSCITRSGSADWRQMMERTEGPIHISGRVLRAGWLSPLGRPPHSFCHQSADVVYQKEKKSLFLLFSFFFLLFFNMQCALEKMNRMRGKPAGWWSVRHASPAETEWLWKREKKERKKDRQTDRSRVVCRRETQEPASKWTLKRAATRWQTSFPWKRKKEKKNKLGFVSFLIIKRRGPAWRYETRGRPENLKLVTLIRFIWGKVFRVINYSFPTSFSIHWRETYCSSGNDIVLCTFGKLFSPIKKDLSV